ncbi:MAG: hypothetical protein IJP27_00105, partial [Clostridia bacterium]|nr:hypothetical protein [Clostridia bacterium]
MTCTEYIENLLKTYQRVAILSEKNDCIAYRLRHKTLGQDLVVHRFPKVLTAYETLCGIRSPHLPLIYDTITLEDGQIVLEEY